NPTFQDLATGIGQISVGVDFKAGDEHVIAESYSSVTVNTPYYVKKKEIKITSNLKEIRVSFLVSQIDSGTSHGRIYVNGVPKGLDRVSDGSRTFVEDIKVKKNDLVQIYGRVGTANTGYIAQLKLMVSPNIA